MIKEISNSFYTTPDPRQVIDNIFGDLPDVVYALPSSVRYKCDCNISRIRRLVLSLGRQEAFDIVKEQGCIEVQCHFCGKKYRLEQQDVEQLFDKKSK